MKRSPILVLAASVALVLVAGCAARPDYYESESLNFGVDAVSASISGAELDVTVTHHGTMKEGVDGWTFQVYVDADHDPSTGVDGAEYMVNGFEGRTAGGYAVRTADPKGQWGGIIGRVGSDDGTTLSLALPLALVPPTAAPTTVRVAVYAAHKLVHDQTIAID